MTENVVFDEVIMIMRIQVDLLIMWDILTQTCNIYKI